MQTQRNVSVTLELGHSARPKREVTPEGASHDWVLFVRGRDDADIQHFVEKVVFRLHDSFPNPRRVCKEPPYRVEESGSGGFLAPIEVHFKKKELPKKVCFKYEVFVNQEAQTPVSHLRCEKITFCNPSKDFRRRLIRAGGVLVLPGGDGGDCGPLESTAPEEGISPDT